MKNKILLNIFLLSITLFTFINQSVLAGEHGTPQITTKQDANSRVQYAKNLLSFLRKIDESIPSLSPSQKQWLEKEMEEYKKSENISRYFEISNTKEYKMRTVKNYLGSMSSTLSLIIMKPPTSEETYLWSLITEDLMAADFWFSLRTLIDEFGLVDKKLFYSDSVKTIDQDIFYLNNGVIPAWQILRNVIQPFLKKQSKQ
jgi:hypothetical protein